MKNHARIAVTLLSTVALHVGAARAQSAEEIAAPFAKVAGSLENAVKLARGLHTGKMVALQSLDDHGNRMLVAFGLPEGGMSWSEVRTTLARVQSTLANNGIQQASARDVQAALLGGEIKRHDGSAVSVEPTLDARPRATATAFPAPGTDGMPIYGAVPALPDVSPTTWGSYRPSTRPSRHIEHVSRVISAGYLREPS